MIRLKVDTDSAATLRVGDQETPDFSVEPVKVRDIGSSDHRKLDNRDALDQHPMSAITGLEQALQGKQPVGAYLEKETDPTVPAWAKAEKKPSYTAQEVGAMPAGTKIPTKTSDLEHDSGFLTSFTETDPTVPGWAKKPSKPDYSASEVGADPAGTAVTAVSEHNVSPNAHNDLRLLITGLTERLNALANSDDTTLDQMAEVVAYIKDNRELIEQVTTGKVSVDAIIDNLTTNVSDKPLSAAQGVVLKGLIDAIEIPTKVSAFENDAGYLKNYYSCVWEHQITADTPPKADWSITLYKNGTVCKDAVYAEFLYSNTADAPTASKSSYTGMMTGTKSFSSTVAIKYRVNFYANENKTTLLHTEMLDPCIFDTKNIVNLLYPVGAIYISTVATSPATLFGFGTWEQIQDTFLLAAGSTYAAGATGGSATVTPEVSSAHAYINFIDNQLHINRKTLTWKTNVIANLTCNMINSGTAAQVESTRIAKVDATMKSHTNLPPYLAVYVWKRTA